MLYIRRCIAVAALALLLLGLPPATRAAESAPPPVPNGFDILVKASTLLVISPRFDNTDPQNFANAATLHAAEAVIRQNQPAIALMRQAFECAYRAPVATSLEEPWPWLAKWRKLARILSLEARVDFYKGDTAGGIQASIDAVELGQEIPGNAAWVYALVGMACQSIGRHPLWDNLSKLTPDQSRAAIKRLEAIDAKEVPIADTLRAEKALGHVVLREYFNKPHWQSALARAISFGHSDREQELLDQLQSPDSTQSAILADYDSYMDALIAAAPQSSPAGRDSLPTRGAVTATIALSGDGFDHLAFEHARAATEQALLETTLALRAYKKEHGAYPESLDTLTPAYLPSVPLDPFATGGDPLKYRVSGGLPVLYSVGPDGSDDGGTPFRDPSNTKAPTSFNKDSQGDIVAGVNGW